ncbi:MAG: thioredoxin domain-containing protein [bacterium]|nr:thioredoxin domain-containing protein [bacterium]
MAGPNRLARETSPYLLQHAHNPVDWYPWGDEAFARARAEDRPVLLSIGYSSCHWCHVMERESFEDAHIAELMNELFVNIKVDREERPDVDDVYMRAVQLLIGRGGWPLTVFLTPERKPFHGGTYFPPQDRHGLPGFPRVLAAVAQAYRERRVDVDKATAQLVAGVTASDEATSPGMALDPSLPRRAAEALLAHVDTEWGGLGSAPKFPHSQIFQLMLRQHRATGRDDLLAAVVLTCRCMAEGGMYDQIGGGFHRYSVDARWLVPHFEKMLYDNAQLPRLYLETWQMTREPFLRSIVEGTLDYVLREMTHSDGGFFSATDADSEGEEGRFFLWTPAQVAAVVDPADVDLVTRFWDVTDEGNFEGRSIPHPTLTVEQTAKMFGRSPDDVFAALAGARAALYAERQRRVPPLRDEKILTSWNALMIGTLAEAGRVVDAPRFVAAAERAAEFLWSSVRRDGRLLHQWTAGEAKQDGFLDDHAFLAAACLDLFEATADRRHLERALELVVTLEARFHDSAGGGYWFTAHDAEALIARGKSGADGAIPSGNATAAVTLLRLHALTAEDRYRERAEEILRLYVEAATRNPFGYATWLEALERWSEGATEIVIVGPRDAPGARELWRVVAEQFLPNRVLLRADADDRDALAPARDRPTVDGKPTAYVCRHFACAAPVHTPEELAALLVAPRAG